MAATIREMWKRKFAHILSPWDRGGGGGAFEVVSKMKKCANVGDKKNFCEKTKNSSKCLENPICEAKTHKCIFLESRGQ